MSSNRHVSCTGAKADHRLALRPGDVERLARALASKLDVGGGEAGGEPFEAHARCGGRGGRGSGRHTRVARLVIAGDRQPAVVHLLAHALNQRLGERRQDGRVISTPCRRDSQSRRVAPWASSPRRLNDGQVECLLILGGNPVYTAAADLQFDQALGKVPLRIHLGLYEDETSRLCHWHLPETHYLEAWSDARAFDGTASLVQPVDRAAVPRALGT